MDAPAQVDDDDPNNEFVGIAAPANKNAFTIRMVPDAYAVVMAVDTGAGVDIVWRDIGPAALVQPHQVSVLTWRSPDAVDELRGVGVVRASAFDTAGALTYLVYATFYAQGESKVLAALIDYDPTPIRTGYGYSLREAQKSLLGRGADVGRSGVDVSEEDG
ncbi:MAG: hypothetical protein KC621_23525 [Myxococcales bacterium]|nr:hypothetical protein [Myxococcales bacterium]